MAYALLVKPINVKNPLYKLSLTESGADDVAKHNINEYFKVTISDADMTAIINDEKIISNYDGTTATVVSNPDPFIDWTLEALTSHKNSLIKAHDQKLANIADGSDSVSTEHKTNIENSKTALEALDVSTMGTFAYGFHKKLSEMGQTSILSVYQI